MHRETAATTWSPSNYMGAVKVMLALNSPKSSRATRYVAVETYRSHGVKFILGIDEWLTKAYSCPSSHSRNYPMTTSDSEPSKSIELAAEIVAAFVANNSLPISELPALIHSVHAALTGVASGSASAAPSVEKKEPAVSIRKSITPDYLVCLDDGKKFKSLRRHLATLGLTPDEYRSKWGLAADYPMVAPNYAAQRSELAKRSGLGQLRKSAAAPAKKAASAAPRKRGRPAKAGA
jgi:predicted transcriptional regulator